MNPTDPIPNDIKPAILEWHHTLAPLPNDLRWLCIISSLTGSGLFEHIPVTVTLAFQTIPQDENLLKAKAHFILLLKECLLKISTLCGVPKTINALTKVVSIQTEDFDSFLPKKPIRKPQSESDIRARGHVFFDTVYSSQAEKLRSKLNTMYPDLWDYISYDVYGKILSDLTLLDAKYTELVSVAVLVPLNVPPQLKSHQLGSLKVGWDQIAVNGVTKVAKEITRLGIMTYLSANHL